MCFAISPTTLGFEYQPYNFQTLMGAKNVRERLTSYRGKQQSAKGART